jgi:Asp-tRNA(Asn)/Glu-tRNA(Gln) amidotransferase A subunit family amidase
MMAKNNIKNIQSAVSSIKLDKTCSIRAAAPPLAPAFLGLPCASVPTGLSRGIPIGVQLVGARFRKDIYLDAAEAIELRARAMTPIDPF